MNRTITALLSISLLPAWLLASPTEAPMGKLADENYRLARYESALRQSVDARAQAAEFAQQRGWPLTGRFADDREFSLRTVTPEGFPVYQETLSLEAARNTCAVEANQLFSATGSGYIVGVWDGGVPKTTHPEFDSNGVSRIVVGDTGYMSSHPTMVAGIIAAKGGIDPLVVGGAPEVFIEAYDLYNDSAEMLGRVAATSDDRERILISNHSYGDLHGWSGISYYGQTWTADGTGDREDPNFGRYGERAAEIDNILYEAPYYLFFKATGNDRNQGFTGSRNGTGTFYHWNGITWAAATWNAATAPYDDYADNGGYDTIIDNANGKNSIAVGAIATIIRNGVLDTSLETMTSFSGWGPTDDGRVKPDCVGMGSGVRGPSTSAAGYGSGSGTSFSSPNVASTALLLIDMFDDAFGTLPRASTTKALLLHTASDLGRPGPDYVYGWGLPDAVAAHAVIAQQQSAPGANALVEGLLDSSNAADEYFIEWDGNSDLKATLSWTDPAASPRPLTVDDRTPVLVNDLDLRLIAEDGTVFQPWKLDPANPTANATRGDNVVDTIEQVLLPAGSGYGTFRVAVSHKGTLANAHQWYSLVVTGQDDASLAAPVLDPTSVQAVAAMEGEYRLRLDGANFTPGTGIALRRAGEADVTAFSVQSAPQALIGTIDLDGLARGAWDVIVTRPDGSTAELPAGLTLQTAEPVFTGPLSLTVAEGQSLQAAFEAIDPITGQPVAIEAVLPTNWMSFSAGTLTISPTMYCGPVSETVELLATGTSDPTATTRFFVEVSITNTPMLQNGFILDSDTVEVTFDTPMSDSVLDAAAWNIALGNRDFTVTGIERTSATAFIVTAPGAFSQAYVSRRPTRKQWTVSVAGVADTYGSTITADSGFGTIQVGPSNSGKPTTGRPVKELISRK